MKWLLIAAAIVAVAPVTDFLVDRQLSSVAYSRSEVEQLTALIDQSKTKAEQAVERKRMSKREVNEAMLYLWGDK